MQPKSSGGEGKSWDVKLTELATDIASKLPDLFDIEKVEVWYPVRFDESMNTVLTQELMRFNGLLGVVKKSLVDVVKAIKGEVVMSQQLEDMGNSMVKGWVPAMWSAVSYPSLKPLGSWVNDLLARLKVRSRVRVVVTVCAGDACQGLWSPVTCGLLLFVLLRSHAVPVFLRAAAARLD